jgi:hypothetical protein
VNEIAIVTPAAPKKRAPINDSGRLGGDAFAAVGSFGSSPS